MKDDRPDAGDEGAAIAELLLSLMGEPATLTEAELRRRLVTAASLGRRVEAVKAVLAAETLARESESSHADDVTRMAKSVRDTLDRAGVGERERRLRERRFLSIGPSMPSST